MEPGIDTYPQSPRRPLLIVLVFFLAGTITGLHIIVAPAFLLVVAGLLLLLSALSAFGGYRYIGIAALSRILLFCGIFMISAANSRIRVDGAAGGVILPDGLSDSISVPVRVTGTVVGDVRRITGRRLTRYEFDLHLESLRGDLPVELQSGVRLSVVAFDGLRYIPVTGERWNLAGRLIFMPSRIDAGYIPRLILRRGGHRRLDVASSSLSGGLLAARRKAAGMLALGIEQYPRQVDVIHALTLGYREGLHPDVVALFRQTGTLHIFAISGLHVGIFSALLVFVLRALRISRPYWFYYLVPLLCGYTYATGAAPSAVRACIMALLFHGAYALGRNPDGLSALAAAAILILGVDPLQIRAIGFIYSFVVVTGLILMHAPLANWLRQLWALDPLAEPPSRQENLLRGVWDYFVSLLALSVCAWLFSAPLTMYFFGRLVPVAIVSNLLVVPMAFLVVTSACLSIVFGSPLTVLAEIFNHAALFLVVIMTAVLELFAKIPAFYLQSPQHSLLFVVSCYLLLLAAINIRKYSKKLR